MAIVYNGTVQHPLNCDNLKGLRKRLMIRLGYASQADNPPQAMKDLLDDFINDAQGWIARQYPVTRQDHIFTWQLQPGERFYGIEAQTEAPLDLRIDPLAIKWAGATQNDATWIPLVNGIDPRHYAANAGGPPAYYQLHDGIEIWPPPADATWKVRIMAKILPEPMKAEGEYCSVDSTAILYMALANAKAHYGKPDAGNYMSMLREYCGNLVAGSHGTRRYQPGGHDFRPTVPPRLIP